MICFGPLEQKCFINALQFIRKKILVIIISIPAVFELSEESCDELLETNSELRSSNGLSALASMETEKNGMEMFTL